MVANFADFSAAPTLLPQNVDAEESLLGAILLDPEAISRVCDKLSPDAFYITAHSLIYKAALAIHQQGDRPDLIQVATYLRDQKWLTKVGGQHRLAELVSSSVSSLNIDRYADLIIDKHIRRQLIEAGNEIVRFGYESFRKLPEIFTEAKERIANLIDSPLLSKEDPDQLAYNKLCLEIQQIELGCVDPGMKLFKLQKLAQQYGRSTKQLEAIYFMSLLKEENESLLTWKELSDRYGDQVREWLLHGFLPKGVVIALHAKGGVGKTRLTYDMLHTLLTGGSWNGFPTTGPRRAIVIQTDESAGDMLDALRKRGFDESLDNIRYKTRWTFEHIPQLRKEIEEFKPEVIVMDSITSMSRHSLFSENDVQYARPILKLKDLAQMFGCSIILIHHSSKAGEARGTSAIFNSVSEVWKLERDPGDRLTDSTKRLLTIEKSRSRRPTTYKLDFEPDQGSWLLLGEAGVDENNPDLSTKERIVKFLLKNLGDRFEAAEISHEINGSLPRVRLCCAHLSADGIISQAKPAIKGRGHANLYFIGVKSDPLNDRGGLGKTNLIEGGDHFKPFEQSGFQPQADLSLTKTTQKNMSAEGEKNDRAIALELKPSNSNISNVIVPPDQAKDHLNAEVQPDHLNTPPDQEQGWMKKLFGALKNNQSRQLTEELPVAQLNDRGGNHFTEAAADPLKNQWGRIKDLGRDTNKLVCVVEPADKNGNMLVSEEESPEFKGGVAFFGTLKVEDFVPLTQVECLALGLRWIKPKLKFSDPIEEANLPAQEIQLGLQIAHSHSEGEVVKVEPGISAVVRWKERKTGKVTESNYRWSTALNLTTSELDQCVPHDGNDFEPAKPSSELTEEDIEDMAESGFDHIPLTEESSTRPRPYHPRTNPPKKGDHIRSGSGKAGQITLTRTTNPRYEITWEDGRKMGYDFQDLETLDIRRDS